MKAAPVHSPLSIPRVDDADIEVAGRYLGVSFDQPRRDILRSNDSFDVQACPGSGKTTLLVAKLATLGANWPHGRRGICVLSHTNVARQEIETKLAGTDVGRRLLTYPHFVGTIHGFVNEFLALPLLRSEGHHVRLVDDDACFEWVRRHLVSWPTRQGLGNLLHKERTMHSAIRALVGAGEVNHTPPPAGVKEDQWGVLICAKAQAVSRGLWYHADMFAWAERLLEKYPDVAELACWRFPAVFLDEMQDTSEPQGHLLSKVFPDSACDLRQRYGDSNQAIYDFGEPATTDRFPAADHRSVPNSQRFGANIAAKAHALAPDPPCPVLAGEGPRSNLFSGGIDPAAMPHTIFLFAPDSAQRVLAAFGSLLLQTFPDEILRSQAFLARAVGRVTRSDQPNERIPRHLSDYWEAFEPRAVKLDARPQYLADCVHLAQRRRVVTVDCAEPVKVVVKGICDLIGTVRPAAIQRGGQTGRWLWEALRTDEASIISLRRLLWEWCIESTPIVEQSWPGKVVELRCALRPVIGTEWSVDADAFCQWSTKTAEQTSGQASEGHSEPNRYRFREDARYVDIDVGTIHSAKGQTHTATLVLETFYKKHDLSCLLPWILRDECGSGPNTGKEEKERMRLVYTAVTRPSHLLCLAIRREAITQDGAEAETRLRLEELGWTLKDVGACEELRDDQS